LCNDYAKEIEAAKWIQYMREMKRVPPFNWIDHHTPNNITPQPHIKITEPGLIVRLKHEKLIGSMTTWAWKQVASRSSIMFPKAETFLRVIVA
jgi:hypothetical protein